MHRDVKLRSTRCPARWRFFHAGLLLPGLMIAGVEPSGAAAAPQRSLLLGGPPAAPPRQPLDPRLPTGAARAPAPRPDTGAYASGCSFRLPVCVHAHRDLPPPVARRALLALELAYERLVWTLDLPSPLGDAGRGGSDSLDLYLAPREKGASERDLSVSTDAPRFGTWDAASAFCTASAGSDPAPFERTATLCVAEAIARRLDPAEAPHTLRAYATHLWWIAGHPTALDVEAIDRLQSTPHAGVGGRELDASSEGSALFFAHLEQHWSLSGPGHLATALLAASSGGTPPSAWRWHNEPDLWDAVRSSVGGGFADFARLTSNWAVARAFLGARDDGSHLGELAWAGWFGSVRFDWSLRWSSLPRRVALSRSLSPTGAAYVWLELDGVELGAVLGFQAECEGPAPFAWSLVRVGRDGRELGRIDVPFQEAARRVEQRLVNLETSAGVIVVGVNVGGLGPAHPFDPDVFPYEPHGCLVYLARL